MKIKTTMWAFTLLTILTVLAGLFMYYNAMKTAALNEDKVVSETHINNINNSISQLISRYNKIALTLSRHEEIVLSLKDDSEINRAQANQILDLFNSSLETSVCYLLNRDGIAIASSNRNDSDSFLGNDYSFRPYYKESMKGNSFVYLAYGVTSGRRGIYFSKPVYAPDSNSIVGIAVIKEEADKIENNILFMHYPTHVAHDDIIVISNEDGVVFISDRKDLLFNTIWQVDENKINHIAVSKQFGKGPLPWAGFKKTNKDKAIDRSDRNYNLLLCPIKDIPGWKIIHFSDSDAISERIYTTIFKTASYVVTLIFIIIGFVLVLLNFLANKAEKKLRESEERYRSVTDALNEGVILQAQSGEILTWNKGAENIFGIPAKDVIGQTSDEKDWPTIHEDGSKFDGKDHPSMKTLHTGKACINEIMGIYQPSGDLRWITVSTNPLLKENCEKPYAVAISFSDITERKQAAETLQKSEREYQSTVEGLLVGVVVHDIDSHILYSNPEASKILGLTAAQMSGKEAIDPEWMFVYENLSPMKTDDYPVSKVISTKNPLTNYVFGIIRPERIYVTWVNVNARPLFFADGKLEKVIVNFMDITALKQSEEAIKRSESMQSKMVANIGDVIVIIDQDGINRYKSSNIEKLFGWKPEDVVGASTWENIHPNDLEATQKFFGKLMSEPDSVGTTECRYRCKDGSYSWIEFTGTNLLHDPDIKGLLGNYHDITKRKQLEEQLRQTQKMESIGNLAGGIAHDFNNLLFPIIGMSEMLLEDLPQDSLEHENAQEIFNAGKRAGDLVKQILAFSRQSEHKMTPVRIQNVLKEVLKLCRSTIPSNIEIQETIDWECGLIMADATQLHQVAMNLITNAFHAIEEKSGVIDITLKKIELKIGEIPNSLLPPGQYIQLSVADNGVGMSQRIQKKIFDPYFTTKKMGKGTGLGLAVVYGIIKGHKGDIKVYSEEGKGSTFHIYLPLMKTNATPVVDNQSLNLPTGTEKILLVDDEISVAKLEAQMLSRLGYQVTEQTNSSEALNEFKTKPENFDLVISDMTMPNMTGDQLAKEILSIKPDIPIIICTGFSERINKELAEVIGVKGFLMKPVGKYDMAQMVRKVLDENKIF